MSGGINITFRDSNAGEITIRQVGLGLAPMILIEPEYDEATDEASFNLDVTDLDRDGLEGVLRLLADSIASAPDVDA